MIRVQLVFECDGVRELVLDSLLEALSFELRSIYNTSGVTYFCYPGVAKLMITTDLNNLSNNLSGLLTYAKTVFYHRLKRLGVEVNKTYLGSLDSPASEF